MKKLKKQLKSKAEFGAGLLNPTNKSIQRYICRDCDERFKRKNDSQRHQSTAIELKCCELVWQTVEIRSNVETTLEESQSKEK